MIPLHELLDAMFNDFLNPMEALKAWGQLKDALREREVELVRQARAESRPWSDIAQALKRDENVMSILFPENR